MVWCEEYPLLALKPLKKTIMGTYKLVLFLVALLIVFFVRAGEIAGVGVLFKQYFSVLLSVVVLVVILRYVYEVYYVKTYFYDSVKDAVVIRKGVFSISEINLPFARIQDVYVDQDILDRIFGLHDVHLSSATSVSGVLSHIDGVGKESADALRGVLLKRMKSHAK